MARPPYPPGVPTPTPTPRPVATGFVTPADYFSTCVDNLSDAIKNETSLTPDDVLEWTANVLAVMRTAEE